MNKYIFIRNFIADNRAAQGLSFPIISEIEQLVDKYKINIVDDNCSIISVDLGNLGSIKITDIVKFEETYLDYIKGDYQYLSIVTNKVTRILFTDFSTTEPYNRNSSLYLDARFSDLGNPIKETEFYREFINIEERQYGLSLPVRGFRFNTYYHTVHFDICLYTNQVEEFVLKLRELIGK